MRQDHTGVISREEFCPRRAQRFKSDMRQYGILHGSIQRDTGPFLEA